MFEFCIETFGFCTENVRFCIENVGFAEPDSAFYDWILANETVGQLEQAKETPDKPFFIAAGIRRPHRLWHVPKRFYDLYPNNGTPPVGMQLALVSFQWKNPDFQWKNPDFLFKNPDFRLKMLIF